MAGEQAGQLDSVLERLADYTESRHGLRQKVVQAMVYPILLTTIALIIIIVMLIAVVPKVVGVFETTGQELPIMTRILIAISDFVQNWWFLLIAVVVAVVILIVRAAEARAHPQARARLAAARADLRPRDARAEHGRFTRTLSILTASGVPALEALRISASVIANLPMRAAVEEAAVRVREGGAIGRSLSQSKLFPPMSIHLISSGEASGELDSMLERAANHQESEMDSLLATMLSVLEPLLIVIMGLVVLGDRHGDSAADLPDQPARSLSAQLVRARCALGHTKAFSGVLPIPLRRVYKSADCGSWDSPTRIRREE